MIKWTSNFLIFIKFYKIEVGTMDTSFDACRASQVWRHITMSMLLIQEEILEEGIKKYATKSKNHVTKISSR